MTVIVKEFETLSVFFERDGWFNATVVSRKWVKNPIEWINSDEAFNYGVALAKSLNLLNHCLNTQLEMIQNCDNQTVKRAMISKFLKDVGLVRTKRGSPENGGGTWMHPKLGVVFARWLSSDFAVWCDSQIEEIIRQERFVDIFPTVVHPTLGFPQVDTPEDLMLRSERNTYARTLILLGFRSTTYVRELTDVVNEIFTGDRARHLRFRYNITNRHHRTRGSFDANLRRAVGETEKRVCRRFRRLIGSELNFENMLRTAREISLDVYEEYLERDITLIENIPRRRLPDEHNARLFPMTTTY